MPEYKEEQPGIDTQLCLFVKPYNYMSTILLLFNPFLYTLFAYLLLHHVGLSACLPVCLRVRVRVRERARVRVRVRARMHACMRACVLACLLTCARSACAFKHTCVTYMKKMHADIPIYIRTHSPHEMCYQYGSYHYDCAVLLCVWVLDGFGFQEMFKSYVQSLLPAWS